MTVLDDVSLDNVIPSKPEQAETNKKQTRQKKHTTRLGREIKKLCVDLDLTMTELAKRSGITPSKLSAACAGNASLGPDVIELLFSGGVESGIYNDDFIAEMIKADAVMKVVFKFNTSNSSESVKRFFVALESSFYKLDDYQTENLIKIINGADGYDQG